MKNLINTAFFSTALLATGLAGAADLTIHVDDVKSVNGQVTAAVFNSADTFLRKPVKGTGAVASREGNTLVFRDLPEGEYAFVVLHDTNSNNKMDSSVFGIPTEDYAFSNNAIGRMGPPSYEAAKFVLPAAGATFRVSLK